MGQDTRGTAGGFGFENRSWNRRSFAVDIGKPASGAQTTAYFRHRFRTQVELAELYVRLQRQDGVIVYLDGVEVGRDNMTDSEGFRSRSRTSVTFDAESRPIIIRLSGTLPAGEHVIAISLHGSGSPNASLRIAEISLHGRPVGQDLIALERPSDLFTRGLAFLELNQSEKGEADFAKAYELLGGAGVASSDKLSKALLRVADVYRDKNDLAFALKVVDLAVMADSKSADALHSRGSLLARQLKWKEAAEYLSHAVELAPDNYLFSYPLSPILVELGQLDRYREHCAQMVKRFAAADVVSAGSIMQDCLWLPDSVTDWQSLIDLWKSITEELPVWQRDTRRAILGLFEYRAGRPEAAIALIQNNTDSLDAANKVQALAMLAMAYQDTGRTDEAKSTLQQAEGLLDSARPDLGHAYSWHDWLAARILRREAVGRIRGSGDRWFVEAQDLEAEGRLDEALERLARPEVEQAAGPRMFVLRANIWARRGNEREAAAEYVRAADRANEDTIAWMRGAALLAESPDVQAYQAYCAKMLAQFAETARPEFAERVAKAGLLLAPVPPELEGALKLADKSVTIDPAHWVIPWAQPIKGLAEYRRGNYQNAIDWAQKTLDGSSRVWYRDSLSHLVKAMAQKQLGLDEPAQKSLAAAKELIDPKTQQIESDGLHDDWHDWKIDCILLREAEGLIKNIR